jgi:hypothetical protein
MRPKTIGQFTLREIKVKKHQAGRAIQYSTFLLSGWRQNRRYRRQFKSREDAIGAKHALEVEAANAGGQIKVRNTGISDAQLAEAEVAFARLGSKSLTSAVVWYLTTYKPR